MKQVQDYYFKKAKSEKYLARSVYKLEEIQKKHRIFSQGNYVLDLGCSPGSWLQYISQIIGKKGKAIGVDLQPVKWKMPENTHFFQVDVQQLNSDNIPFDYLFDTIVSDMAPKTTGIRVVDAEHSFQLCKQVLSIADFLLKSKGSVLVKSFQGSSFEDLLALFHTKYQITKVIKPKSSRKESVEVFILGKRKKNFNRSVI